VCQPARARTVTAHRPAYRLDRATTRIRVCIFLCVTPISVQLIPPAYLVPLINTLTSLMFAMKSTFSMLAVLLASVTATPVLETRGDAALIKRGSAHPKRGAAFNSAGAVDALADK
jgi:hypothetical protein